MNGVIRSKRSISRLEQAFESYRLSEEVLAYAYEQLIPRTDRFPVSLDSRSQAAFEVRQPEEARRAGA
jgi:hypothetical protein